MTDFEHCLSKAGAGRSIVEKCLEHAGCDKAAHTTVLVCPDNDALLWNAVCKYFDRYIMEHGYDAAVVISSFCAAGLREQTEAKMAFYEISDSEMESVLRFSAVSPLCVLSLRQPFHQKLYDLVGFKDIDIDKIVCRCLFNIAGNVRALDHGII
jgi:hypothetical protein